MLTFRAFCQFLKLLSSPIRSWDSGISNFILWNWTYLFFVPTRNIFKLNLKVYNINWNLQIIILSQTYPAITCYISNWLKIRVNFCCCTINVMRETHIFGTQKCWSVHLEGRGSEKVYCLYNHEHVDILGWPLIIMTFIIIIIIM